VVQVLQFIFIYNPAHSCYGFSWYGICKDAHGVFGELDRETVHFIWDGLILVACIVVKVHFRKSKNIWLTLAVVAAAIHQAEHIFLFGTFLFDNNFYNNGGYFLGIHITSGYGAQNGVMGHDGLVGTLIPFLNPILPARIPLHFVYNTFVLIPMLLGFRKQVQYIYDEWLAKALPNLTEEQLIAATVQSENVKFAPGQIVFRQGDPADKFYIITKGQVDVLRQDEKTSQEIQVARLSEGQYFGEIGVLGNTGRTATIKAVTQVECLALNRDVFKEMIASSSAAYKDVDVVLRRRLVHLGAIQGLPIQDSVNADPDTVLKTRMIRDRLKMLDGNDISKMYGRTASSIADTPTHIRPIHEVGYGGVATVAERPATTVMTGTESANNGFHRGVLIVRTGPSAGQRFDINAPRIIVGRRGADSSTDLSVPGMKVDDGRVSRQHLEIVAKPDGLYARDLGSANGTWLNGRQLRGEPARLEDGAEIQIGPDTKLNFRVS